MAEKPCITALNKVDALSDDERDARIAALNDATGGPVLALSGVSREGVQAVLRALRHEIIGDMEVETETVEDAPWRP